MYFENYNLHEDKPSKYWKLKYLKSSKNVDMMFLGFKRWQEEIASMAVCLS